MEITFERGLLFFDAQLIHKFDWPIQEVLVFSKSNSIVTILKRDCYRRDSQNVFCLNFDGELRWQIPKVKLVIRSDDGISPYVNIMKEGEFVKALNWDGTELTIDPSTGVIIKNEWSK